MITDQIMSMQEFNALTLICRLVGERERQRQVLLDDFILSQVVRLMNIIDPFSNDKVFHHLAEIYRQRQ
jgi:hypothetical protein